eukprot:TRINITY_DN47594_c0_g1_i1.p1 TRINITY_DN47594_c0_g1~~TRINITY_DN47594_c0_g1_i1.p1  ORF type:complete len:619 (+),score=186.59 TRINITY_DN47594_c0_g1_i1:82-1857(+)
MPADTRFGQIKAATTRRELDALLLEWRRQRKRLHDGHIAAVLRQARDRPLSPDAAAYLTDAVRRFLREKEGNTVDHQHIAAALHGACKAFAAVPTRDLEALLLLLAEMARRGRGSDPRSVSAALFGLADAPPSAAAAVVSALTPLARRCRDIDPRGVANCLFGLKGVPAAAADDMMAALAPVIARCQGVLTDKELMQATAGLAKRKGSPEAGAVAAALVQLVRRSAARGTRLRAEHAGMVMFGMAGVPDGGGARELISALSGMLRSSRVPLRPQQVSRALYGMGPHVGSPAGAAALRTVLDTPWEGSDVGALDVGMALYGLRECGAREIGGAKVSDSQRRLVRDLTEKLAQMVSRCAEPLSPHSLGMALHGIGGVHADDARQLRRALLRIVTAHGIDQTVAPEDTNIAAALYGLRVTRGDNDGMLRAVVPLIRRVPSFSPATLGMSLYGIPEGRAGDVAFEALLPHAERCSGHTPQSFSTSLYGLFHRGSSPASRRLLVALLPAVGGLRNVTSAAVATAIQGLRGQDDTPELSAMVSALVPIARRVDPADGPRAVTGAEALAAGVGSRECRELLSVLTERMSEALAGRIGQ